MAWAKKLNVFIEWKLMRGLFKKLSILDQSSFWKGIECFLERNREEWLCRVWFNSIVESLQTEY